MFGRAIAAAISLALIPAPPAPLVRQIDHVMFVGGPEVSGLVTILRDGFELPVVFDGAAQVPPTGGTGIGLGNVTLEIVARRPEPGQATSAGRLGSLALQAENFASLPDELTAGQIEHFPPAPQARWTTIGLRGLGGGVFFIDYKFDMDARRAEFARVLADRRGGPLGIVGVREVTVSPDDLNAVRPGWLRLLGTPVAGDPYFWKVGGGPAVRMVARDSPLQGRVLVGVRDISRAAVALRRLKVAYDESQGLVTIEPSALSGLRLVLTDS